MLQAKPSTLHKQIELLIQTSTLDENEKEDRIKLLPQAVSIASIAPEYLQQFCVDILWLFPKIGVSELKEYINIWKDRLHAINQNIEKWADENNLPRESLAFDIDKKVKHFTRELNETEEKDEDIQNLHEISAQL